MTHGKLMSDRPPFVRNASAARGLCLTTAVLLATIGGRAQPLRADPAPQTFSFDVQLAPVQVDGTFQLTIDTPTGPVQGTLQVDTSVAGKLSGSLVVGLRSFAVKGSVSHGKKGTHAAFTATSGPDRISFSGGIVGTTLAGRSTGKGSLASGKHNFAANLATAGAETATLECAVTEDATGRLTGTGHVIACGDTIDLKVSGSRGKKTYSLSLKQGKTFKFTGTGPSTTGDVAVNWTVKGFGASASGVGAVVASVAAPAPLTYAAGTSEFETETTIVPLAPLTGSAPRGKFSIAPSVPAGIVFDAATGAISGTPIEVRDTTAYTVTAANFAGSSSAVVSFKTRINRARSFAAETRTLADDDLRHFLTRTQFGVPAGELAKLQSQGLSSFIDASLNFNQSGPAEAIAAPELVNATDPPGYSGKFPSATQLARWWSSLMINSNNPFQERMAFFWCDLFAVSTDNLETGENHLMQDYVNLYRYEGNGNLRSLLLKMARSGAMIKYLDGYRNTATAPNENFGREFWELFTLGVDNGYTQADIVQAAKAFTGYKQTTDPTTGLVSMVFDPTRHDSRNKTVLGFTIGGQPVTDDYQAMVDLTLDHAAVAEFITTKLFEHFCYEKPPATLVADMAAYLRSQNYELAPFLRALLRSEAFFSTASRRSLVKNPVEFSIGFIQATGLKLTPSTLQGQLSTLGQVPTQPPTVNGWVQGDLWFSAQNMADRANLAYLCIEDTTRQRTAGIEVANILPPIGQRSAGEVVDALTKLLRVTLSDAERTSCIDYLNTQRQTNGTYTASTFDGSSQAHLDERVRGLLYILAQHPTYQIR
ncbi:MAG: DUF1800 family protein [Planctomycetes bacterium]|nr:DUF1800 family protein [Planctomycetota bacterium]